MIAIDFTPNFNGSGAFFAPGCSFEQSKWLGEQGWYFFGNRSAPDMTAKLRAAGVPINTRWLPGTQVAIASKVFGADGVQWTEAATKAVAPAATAQVNSRSEFGGHIDIPTPSGLSYRPYQITAVAFAQDAFKEGKTGVLFADPMGLGKQHPIDTKIVTPTGWREIGSLSIGDMVIGSTGAPVKITGVFPQGVKPSYRVSFSDQSSVESGPEHLWTVWYRTGHNDHRVTLTLTTEQLRTRPAIDMHWTVGTRKVTQLYLSKHTLYLPMMTGPAHGSASELPIPPYVLGQLIANASLAHGTPQLVVGTVDWPDLEPHITACGITPSRVRAYGTATHVIFGGGMIKLVRALGLDVLSREKRIPTQYLTACQDDRLALFHGLMDGDGTISATRNKIAYCTIAKGLAEDIRELVESLGGIASIRAYDRSHDNKPTDYSVRMRLPTWVPPFRISRKLSRYNPGRNAQPCRSVVSVEYVRDVESVCISVDAPDQLYATEHHILTHNTMQAIGVMAVDRPRRVLVACPASLRVNWAREIEKWIPGTKVMVVGNETELPQEGVVIINYDRVVGKRARATELRKSILANRWDLVILDEAHMLKNEDAQRTHVFFGKFKYGKQSDVGVIHKADKVLLLTGTPIQNRVKESIPLLRAIGAFGPGMPFSSEYGFLMRYCDSGVKEIVRRNAKGVIERKTVREFAGAHHLDELQGKLRSGLMIRRLKADVAKELPPKIRQIVPIPFSREDDGYDEDLVWTDGKLALTMPEGGSFEDAVHALLGHVMPFDQIAGYRAKLAEAKAPMAVEHVKALLDEDDTRKLLVFGHHMTMLDSLEAGLAEYGTIRIDGSVAPDHRQALVDQFQASGGPRVAVLGMRAAGVGLTLTAASMVVMAEADWNPSWCMQSEDRAHRLGTTADIITVQYLVLDNTLDAHVVKMMVDKMDVSDRALDRTQKVSAAPADEKPKAPASTNENEVTIKVHGEPVTFTITPDRASAVREALVYLSSRCDGAITEDGAGFNGRDAGSDFVQSLVEKARAGILMDKDVAWGLKVLRTYSNGQVAHLHDRLYPE